jgi:hypothetical protein
MDLVYQIDEFGAWNTLVNSGFTVAYCTILNEHYEGKTPTSKQPTAKTQTPSQSTPAFTSIGTLLSVALALALFRS